MAWATAPLLLWSLGKASNDDTTQQLIMPYDDDDLYDDYDEEYDDEMLDAIDSVKANLKSKKFTDDEIADFLYDNDYDTVGAVDYFNGISEKQAQKEADKQKAKDSRIQEEKGEYIKKVDDGSKNGESVKRASSKLSMLAGKARVGDSTNEVNNQSALSRLAAKKSSNSHENFKTKVELEPKTSELSALAGKSNEKKEIFLTPIEKLAASANTSTAKSKLSALALSKSSADNLSALKSRLSKSSANVGNKGHSQQETESIPASKLASLASKRRPLQPVSRQSKPQQNQQRAPESPKKQTPVAKKQIFPDIDYSFTGPNFPQSPSQQTSSPFASFIFCPFRNNAVLKEKSTNILPVAKNLSAFNKPSPDDVVAIAQNSDHQKAPKTAVNELTTQLKNSTISGALAVPTAKTLAERRKELSLMIEKARENQKSQLSFVVIGHVDAGKSTLMGRLLLDTGNVDKHLVEKYKKEANSIGKGSFALAWILDQTNEERSRGVTMDICVSAFDTKNTHFTIVDSPGHRDFVPNMIAGSSQVDAALLVIDSSRGGFESGFEMDGQTKEHAVLAKSLGVEFIVVALSKMDNVEWAEDRFVEIQDILLDYLTKNVGYKSSSIIFVPCSGLSGTNVSKPPDGKEAKLLSWYKGDTLVGALEKVAQEQSQISLDTDAIANGTIPMRISISDVESEDHTSGITLRGRVVAGAVLSGDIVVVSPSMKKIEIKSIVKNGGSGADFAVVKDQVSLVVNDTQLTDVHAGDIITDLGHPLKATAKITSSRIITFEHTRPVTVGTRALFHQGRLEVPCRITKLISLLNKSSGAVIKENPRVVVSGQAVVAEITLEKPVSLGLFKDSKELGRYVLRKDGRTIAAGVVDEIS